MQKNTQKIMQQLVKAAMGKRSVQQTFLQMQLFIEKNPDLGYSISKQYLQSIVDGHAPENPGFKKILMIHETLKIPIPELINAYGGNILGSEEQASLPKNIIDKLYEDHSQMRQELDKLNELAK